MKSDSRRRLRVRARLGDSLNSSGFPGECGNRMKGAIISADVKQLMYRMGIGRKKRVKSGRRESADRAGVAVGARKGNGQTK